MWSAAISLLAFPRPAQGAVVQGDCVSADKGLQWLSGVLSPSSAISCLGQPLQQANSRRYWGTQFGKNASVVVYPSSTRDVSLTMQAARRSPLGRDFAVVCGAHSQTNASSSYGLVVDLSWMNRSRVVRDFAVRHGTETTNITAVEYEGGANWGQVQTATNGTGYTAIGARVANVGTGGFSLGGGIGFLAGAYGFASDRLVQVEVVLPSGKTVMASKSDDKYKDLLWALQGGSGQFGIVTRFWQEAVPEPKRSTLAFYYIDDQDVPRLREQTVAFFNNNTDPFSVVYYSVGFLSSDMAHATPETYARRTLLITVHFEDAGNPNQLNNEDTFRELFAGIDTSKKMVLETKYYSDLCFVGEAAYPYGYRRGFYGGQTTEIDVDYLANVTTKFDAYLDELQKRGEKPYTASFIVQYMFPGLNGFAPKADDGTAWPHSTVGHQTLFTPAYLDAANDMLAMSALKDLDQITQDRQARVGGPLRDYPNYASPRARGQRVWGENVHRLMELKEKYDPDCMLSNGLVFASSGCRWRGRGTVFVD